MKHVVKLKTHLLFSALFIVSIALFFPSFGHIAADSGRTLQLLSFKMSGAAPTIDGDVATSDPREWQEAYNRKITLTDDNEPLSNDTATLLLMNDDNYLYVALAYEWNNTGANNIVSFYFDEGASGGSHDDALSAGNEDGAIFRIGTNTSRQDLYWNGTAWAIDADAENDFNSGWDFSATINNIEMRIPLNNAKTDNATNSDLDVSATDELGFFFKINKQGMAGAGTVYWDQFPGTSENVVANYADIQLGVQRTYSTLYATYKALASSPNLTNGITGDDAWRGCYSRDIVLTNFMGSTLRGTMYLIDDASANLIYTGIKITDENNASDYIRLYQEQKPTTNDTYDALLDDNAENCLELTAGNTFADKYFNQAVTNDVPGTWEDDPEAADNSAGYAAYNATTGQHEFELRVDRNAGAYDLTLNDGANSQFLLEYYDADAAAGERLYYWSNSTNNVQVTADQTNSPPNRVALGYGVLQLGAPYCQVISPEDGSVVEGVVHVRVYVEKSGSATADSVRFYRAAASSTTYAMTRIASLYEWTGTYDVTALDNNTSDTLVIQAFDGALTMERLVIVTVSSDSGNVVYPSVSITSPAAGSLLSGQNTINFTATITGGFSILSREISVDGGGFTATTANTTHTWNTTPLADGSHTVQIRTTGTNGMSATSSIVTYVTANAPEVAITAPAAGSTVSGNVTLTYTATAKPTATIAADSLSIDGGAWTAINLSGTDTLETGSLSDGSHSIQIKTTDSNGKSGLSKTIMITVQNSPAVAITAPRADSVVSGTLVVLFTATAVAPATIDSTQISVDGGAWRSTSTGSTDTLNTQNMTEGAHTIQVKAIDNNGKTATSAIVSFVVRNNPTVTITSPRPDSVVSGTLVVLFTATPVAPATIDSTQISVDGGAWRATSTGSTDTLNTQNMTEGAHTIQVKVIDNNGKTATSAIVSFVVQNNPSVTITSPRPDSVVSGTLVVLFTATAVSPATIASTHISVDGGTWRATSTGSTDTLNTQNLTEGSHTIQVRATDNNGKTGTSAIVSFVIQNNPSVTITSPRPDSVVSGTLVVLFTATPIAPATIASTQISVDGGAWRATSTGSTDTLNTANLTEGSHTILVRATDNNGKTGISAIVKFVVRNNPSVTLHLPADTTISGTTTVSFTATPVTPATIVRREIWIDGAFVDTSTTASTYVWNTLLRNDGQHTVQIRITDSNGKTARSELVLVTTFNTPIVRIVSPLDTGVISGIDTIRFTVTYAPGSSRDTTEIAFNGGSWRPTSDSVSYVWVTTDFLDGNHNVQVRATATNGKTGISQIAAYKVINVPQVAILAPVAGEALNGTYTVQFSITPVSPATITRRSVSIDGGPWSDSLVDSASYSMSTIGWEEGTHTIQVRAVDSRGRNGYSSQRTFIVDNAPPIAADPKAQYPNSAGMAARDASVLITVLVKDVLTGLRSDSAVVLRSQRIDTTATLAMVMRDDGQEGDRVAGDNVFSASVTVKNDTTGTVGYSITAADRLNNSVTLTSAIRLDNTPPEITLFTLTPEPETIAGTGGKRSYFEKLVMRGAYSDEGGSGLSRVMVTIRNDSAANVNNSPVDLSPDDSVFSRIIHLVPGMNYMAFEAVDNAGNATVRRDTVTYIEPKATKTISRSGGAVTSPNGVAVTVPKDALLGSAEVTITRVLPIDEPKPLSSAVKLLQVPHDFGPDGTSFRKPVRVTLSYTEADLDPDQNGVNDFDPSKFIIVFWDGSTWLAAGAASVDTAHMLVSVEVNHFTMFDIAQKETASIEKLVTYWTRNPVKASSGSYFNYELPEQGTVSLAILDMAGDLVYQLIRKNTSQPPGTYSVGWRGQNVAERFAGAGLYVYLFTYKSSVTGETKIIRKPIGLLQ
ncbi:MAG: hypothetical protein JW768_04405 [Chitinispirillaceae bacterium]|nr:hypothetical protein [Chitinispirillaceae bacterium]